MLERRVQGRVPRKHHIVFRDEAGALYWEECFTRAGFDGPYTILYHRHRPHEQAVARVQHGWAPPVAAPDALERPLARQHYRTQELARRGGAPVDARVPLCFSADVVVSIARPDAPDPTYVANADADELLFVQEGGGVVRSVLGDLRFEQGDYVFLPAALVHRIIPDTRPQSWLSLELHDVGLLKQWRNATGQLRMDAPYCHRDFKKTELVGPLDEGIRHLHVKRGGRWHAFTSPHSPLDVIGWDGTVYPWAFPILNFQPRAGLVHLPPTWHGTFGARGALVCSFVPRALDFHPDAIPCPYPHSSPDCDEIIFYVGGSFTSRNGGVGPGSISHHPTGIPHGPHPGAYEASIGQTSTNELAVMMDVNLPLVPTATALAIADPTYHDSFRE